MKVILFIIVRIIGKLVHEYVIITGVNAELWQESLIDLFRA